MGTWAARIGLLLASLALALGGIELAVRRMNAQHGDRGAQFIFVMQGIPERAGDAAHEVFWRYDSGDDPDGDGIRGEGIAPEVEGRGTVALLGDSICYGINIPAEESLGARLKSQMRALDLCSPGFSTTQERIALARLLEAAKSKPALRPDIVLLLAVDNDRVEYTLSGERLHDACIRVRPDVPGLRGVELPVKLAFDLLVGSAAFRRIAAGWIGFDSDCQRRGAEVAQRELKEIHRLAQQAGAKLLLMPMPKTGGQTLDAGQWMHTHRPLIELAESLGVQVLNPIAALSKAPVSDIAIDPHGHLNGRGHALLADFVAGALAPPPKEAASP